jgi:uncharacterized protein (TIGR02268 family)
MPALSSTAPLLLVLFASVPPVAHSNPDAWDWVAAHHVELTADTTEQEFEVRISPHSTTTFVFNAPLLPDGVMVEQREHFRSVMVDEAVGLLTLLPSGTLPLGRPLVLTARFADGAIPESVTFRLVPHSTQAEPQVQVYRQIRTSESYQREARQERERAEQCETLLERTRAEQNSPGGLLGALETGLVGESQGLAGRDLFSSITQRSGESLWVHKAFSYRAERTKQVAVELELENQGTQPWTVNGVDLVGKKGARPRVLEVRPSKPILPGQTVRVTMVAEATEEDVQGTFILKLGEAGGPRTVTLRGITFP